MRPVCLLLALARTGALTSSQCRRNGIGLAELVEHEGARRGTSPTCVRLRWRGHCARSRRPTSNGGMRWPSGLDSAGKRAAFALYYAPLHFVATAHVVKALGAGGAATAHDHRSGLRDRRRRSRVGACRRRHERGGRHRSSPVGRGGGALDLSRPWPARPGARRRRHRGAARAARGGDRRRLSAQRARRRRAPAGRGPAARGRGPWRAGARARTDRASGDALVGRHRRPVRRGRRARRRMAAQTNLPPSTALLGKAAGLNSREMKVRSLYSGRLRPSRLGSSEAWSRSRPELRL